MESKEETLEPQEELYHIQEATNDDGSVDVEILGWEKEEILNEDRVFVSYRKSTMEVDQESMKWPQKDSDEYKFVRLVRHLGFDLHEANQIEGSVMKFKDGSLVVPENKSILSIVGEKYKNLRKKVFTNIDLTVVFFYSLIMFLSGIPYGIILEISPKVIDYIPFWLDFWMCSVSVTASILGIFGLIYSFDDFFF